MGWLKGGEKSATARRRDKLVQNREMTWLCTCRRIEMAVKSVEDEAEETHVYTHARTKDAQEGGTHTHMSSRRKSTLSTHPHTHTQTRTD